MQFNIKSAMEYSSKLKNVISEVETSLRVNSVLTNRFASVEDSVNNIPAANNGIYKATVTHKKSTLNTILNKELADETVEVGATTDLAKLNPDDRLRLLDDLINERARIDYEIENIKNNSKITDAFSGREVTYDLGCQINKMYREYNSQVLQGLVEMNTELETTINGKMTDVSNTSDKGAVVVNYPIEISAKSNVNNKAVLEKYDDINNRCTINSAKLSEVEISKYFEFTPNFNLNPSIRSLIEKYQPSK